MLNFEPGDRLRAEADRIAEATVARDYARRPLLLERYGDKGRSKYREDILYNITALSSAVDADDVAMFLRYVGWLKILLTHRGVAVDDIIESLRCMTFALRDDAIGDHEVAASYLDDAVARFVSMPDQVESFIGLSEEDGIARRCLEALIRLDAPAARETLENAMAAGLPLGRIYTRVFPPLMREIGRLWQINEISVAHEHYCSTAVQTILAGFYGRLFPATVPTGCSILVACVEGEQHELGARTIADVFELNGWQTSFLGANLPARELVRLIARLRRTPDLIALSATMPSQVVRLASTIAAIRDGSNIPIIVGGYLFHASAGLAEKLSADGCADDADAALSIANDLVAPPA